MKLRQVIMEYAGYIFCQLFSRLYIYAPFQGFPEGILLNLQHIRERGKKLEYLERNQARKRGRNFKRKSIEFELQSYFLIFKIAIM